MAAAVPAVMAGGFRVLAAPRRRPGLLAVNEFVLFFFKKNYIPLRDLNLPLTGYNGRARWQLAFPFLSRIYLRDEYRWANGLSLDEKLVSRPILRRDKADVLKVVGASVSQWDVHVLALCACVPVSVCPTLPMAATAVTVRRVWVLYKERELEWKVVILNKKKKRMKSCNAFHWYDFFEFK
jgi:hypothetical protein